MFLEVSLKRRDEHGAAASGGEVSGRVTGCGDGRLATHDHFTSVNDASQTCGFLAARSAE